MVASADLYGDTYTLYSNKLRHQRIEVRLVEPAGPENFRKTIAEFATVGQRLGIPLIVDNAGCPLLCLPFNHGQ